MSSGKEKWMEAVLGSLQGIRRAKPAPGLFAKIEHKLEHPEGSVIPMSRLRIIAAAVIVLLLLNVFAIRQQVKERTASPVLVSETDDSGPLISNYSLYEL